MGPSPPASRRGLAPALLSQPDAASGARAVTVPFRRPLPLPGLWHLKVRPSVTAHAAPALLPGQRRRGVLTTAPYRVNALPTLLPKIISERLRSARRGCSCSCVCYRGSFHSRAAAAPGAGTPRERASVCGELRGPRAGGCAAAPARVHRGSPFVPQKHPAPRAAFLTGFARVLGLNPRGNAKTARTEPLPTSYR